MRYSIFKKNAFKKRCKYVRDEKNLDMNKYILDFKQLPTSLVYAFDEPDDKISVLNKLVNQGTSEHAPIKRMKFTRPPAPWLKDPEISQAKNVLDNLQTKSRDLNHFDLTVRQNYQTAKNRYKETIRSKKASFLRKALSSRNPKEVWETVHSILDPPKKCINQNPESPNQYFIELASKLRNKENVAFDKTKLATIIPEQEPDGAFVIKHTTFTKVNKFISELRNDCSSDFDNIPVKLIKPVAEDITSPIVNIINSSISKETFPNSWKVARVCSVPKIDNPINEKDVRPISILPVLSKIYEKVIFKQLSDYIERTSIRNPTQSGFRKGHSTQTILQKALNKNKITMLVLIEYSKAFDTIQHS